MTEKVNHVKILIAFLVIALSCPAFALDDFTASIVAGNQPLNVGISSEASNGYDQLDRPMPPPMPRELDAYLYCAGCIFSRLQTDMKSSATEWLLNVNALSSFSLEWNVSNLPKPLDLVLSNASMKSQNSSAFSGGKYSFSIRLRPYLPGDASADCSVNMADLSFIGAALFRDDAFSSLADLREDGTINVLDLATAGVNYGETC